MSIIRSKEDLQNLRHSCRILMSCHKHLQKMVQAGIDAEEVDRFCEEFGKKHGATPAFKTVSGFKYTINFSVDDEITHALPVKGKILKNDCLLKIDTGFVYKGMFSDAAQTYIIGNPDEKDIKMSQITKDALLAGIQQVKAGCTLGDIGNAIDKLAKKYSYGNVRDLGGHGLGYALHESPFVPHYGKAGKGLKLFENKVIAIEPMFTLGTEKIKIKKDGWTIKTQDGSHSAQWEANVLVTKSGFEILTDIKEEDFLD